MAAKIGQFVSADGDTYEVKFSGDDVQEGAITLGVPPVTIGMASGPHKFCGFKSTTATVNILPDAPLLDLYSTRNDGVRLTVTNKTESSSVVFDGYVVPFAFDQPFGDEPFTINAVDLITARKDVKYTNVVIDADDLHETGRLAQDIITTIAYRAGMTGLVVNLNFDWENTMSGDSPLNIMLAQAGFLQDEVSEVDALSYICKFFGYTACCVGRNLYLYDEHCMLNAPEGTRTNANRYGGSSGKWAQYAHYYNDKYSPLNPQSIDGEMLDYVSVSVERGYPIVRVKPVGSNVSVLVPDVCGDYTPDPPAGIETDTAFDSVLDGNTRTNVYRAAVGSTILDTRVSSYEREKLDPIQMWDNGSLLERVTVRRYNYDDNGIVSGCSTSTSTVLWCRAFAPGSGFTLFTQKSPAYSHWGGKVRVMIGAYLANYKQPINDKDSVIYLPWVQLYVNGGFIARTSNFPNNFDYKISSDGNFQPSPFVVVKGGNVFANTTYLDGYVIDILDGSPIYIAGHRKNNWSYDSLYYAHNFIDKLSVDAVGDDIKAEELEIIIGDGDDVMEIDSMITTRKSGQRKGSHLLSGDTAIGVNARPAVVETYTWNKGYMGRSYSERIPIPGILLEQMRERYARPRLAYNITVGKRVLPYAPVIFSGNSYTVDSYKWDIYNNSTMIIID